MTPYQFAVLRYVHRFSSGERLNVGLVMWCPEQYTLLTFVSRRFRRMSVIFPGFDSEVYRAMGKRLRQQFTSMEQRIQNRQPMLFEAPGERERKTRQLEELALLLPELVPLDASCFQWSDIMWGITDDPEARFAALKQEFVTQYERAEVTKRYDEDRLWGAIRSALEEAQLMELVTPDFELGDERYQYRFRSGWQNGIAQVLEPISFDYHEQSRILDKANKWFGRLCTLSNGAPFKFTGIVHGPTDGSLRESYNHALSILRDVPHVRRLATVDELPDIMKLIRSDLSGN